MALFTDGNAIGVADLERFEAAIVHTAQTHGIDLQTKINLAMDEVGDRVLVWLLNSGSLDPQALKRRSIGLSTVVVTSPMKRWLCFHALARVFAEAYNSQLNDRFQGKYQEYSKLATKAARFMLQAGVGLVYSALPRPSKPQAVTQNGISGSDRVFISVTWSDSNQRESAASDAALVEREAGTNITVSLSELPSEIPLTAVGWNVYAGRDVSSLAKQNVLPIGLDESPTYVTFDLNRDKPNDGQQPDCYVTEPVRFWRG